MRNLLLLAIAIMLMCSSACRKSKCDNVSCQNGGHCDENTGQCSCVNGFTGAKCQTDGCTTNTCLHGGTCANGTCQCPAGYTGTHCDSLAIYSKAGVYNGNYIYSNTSVNYTLTVPVTIAATGTNAAVFGFSYVVGGRTYQFSASFLSGANSFVVPPQTVNGLSYSGAGSFNDDVLTASLTEQTSPTLSSSISVSGSKQ